MGEALTACITESQGHPAHAACGQTKHDDHDISAAEIDGGWHSDAQAANISDLDESCDEDAEAEVPELDDPDLSLVRGQALSAKLVAEVRLHSTFRLGSGCDSDMEPEQRPVWAKQQKSLKASMSLSSNKAQTAQRIPTPRLALESISNTTAHTQATSTVSVKHHVVWGHTNSYHIHQHDAKRLLLELEQENQDSGRQPSKLVDSNVLGQGQGDAVEKWPSYTYLIWSSNGEVNLTSQTFEVKAVVRKVIPLMLVRLMSKDGYPDQPTRSAWAKKALITAANDIKIGLEQNSQAAATH